jgi:hypothetical protein
VEESDRRVSSFPPIRVHVREKHLVEPFPFSLSDTLAQTEALRQTDNALCMSARAIPPIADLSSRIRNMAYLYGLQEGVADELGSFMSIALEVSSKST